MAILLNKRIGCESRTVPPLYALRFLLSAKAGHWSDPGRQREPQKRKLPMRESEDLRFGFFSHPCAFMGVGIVA